MVVVGAMAVEKTKEKERKALPPRMPWHSLVMRICKKCASMTVHSHSKTCVT